MPSYYPVYLDLKERRCVVVGGGAEAERKTQGLLECEAKVTVISPEITAALRDLASRGLIEWEAREYRTGDLDGAFLVIAENDKPKVYKQVATEAERRGILLNVMDVTHLCNFIAPAVVRHGGVAFAISTGGLSPALARRLREEMEQSPILRWAEMANMLSEVRLELRSKGVHPEPDRWQECMDDRLLGLFHSGRQAEAKERLRRMLKEQPAATQGAAR